MPPTQKEQMAALLERVGALESEQIAFREQLVAGEQMRADTHKMVAEMYGALMRPQIGHGEKSLVERMAEVTVDIESGKRTADNVLSIAKWLVAIAGNLAAVAALMKLGQIPKE